MVRRTRSALHATLDAIEGIENAVHGKTREDFAAEWLLRQAVAAIAADLDED